MGRCSVVQSAVFVGALAAVVAAAFGAAGMLPWQAQEARINTVVTQVQQCKGATTTKVKTSLTRVWFGFFLLPGGALLCSTA